jgi:hypothetical protein
VFFAAIVGTEYPKRRVSTLYCREGLGLSFHFHYLRPSELYMEARDKVSREASFGRFRYVLAKTQTDVLFVWVRQKQLRCPAI